MNALQKQKLENHLGGLIVKVEEWANVLFVKFVKRTFDAWGETSRQTVCRFVSKKVILPAVKKESQSQWTDFSSIVKELMKIDSSTIGRYADSSDVNAAAKHDYSGMPSKLANAFKDVHKLVDLINQQASQEITELVHRVSNGQLKF